MQTNSTSAHRYRCAPHARTAPERAGPLLRWQAAAASLALLSLCTSVTGCQHKAPAAEQAQKDGPVKAPEPLRAAVMTVHPQTWPTVVRCQGSLVANDQTVIGSRVAGLVAHTLVDVGDAVEPGQTLVSLDDREFVLQLAAAEAALLQARSAIGLKVGEPVSKLDPQNAPPVREARATLEDAQNRRERWQMLRQQNAVTEEELQTLMAAEKVAEARLSAAINGVNSNIALVAVRSAEVDLAQQRLKDAHILAPFAGQIQQRLVAAGTYVQIGSPLVTIVQLDSLRFRGTVPERLATEIQVGQKIRLTIDSVLKPIDAQVTRISPALDMASRSLTFEALIENRDGMLRAGLFAEAEVTIDPAAQSIAILESSLVEFAGAQKVWKLVDGSAKEQKVEPGRRSNGMVEIIDGLKAGDQILVEGAMGRVAQVIAEDAGSDMGRTAFTATSGAQPTPATDPQSQAAVNGLPTNKAATTNQSTSSSTNAAATSPNAAAATQAAPSASRSGAPTLSSGTAPTGASSTSPTSPPPDADPDAAPTAAEAAPPQPDAAGAVQDSVESQNAG